MNVLLLSHQLDYSGAPIALLRLAEALIGQGHRVSLLSKQDGPLGIEFVKCGVQATDSNLAQYDLYFANTFLMVPLALELAPSEDKILAWIHESRAFFRLYGRDETQYGLSRLKRALFPSKFQIEEYRTLMPDCELRQLRNQVSMTGIQRSNSFADFFAVSGAWEPRKNQAGLLKLIDSAGLDIKLNFIGTGKPPSIPCAQHHYFGQVSALEAKRIIAGSCGLISAAINETQNLAAIESILVGHPVLLSSIPAHQELQELIPSVVLFDATDAASFAEGFASVTRLKSDSAHLDEGRDQAERYFGKAAFSEALSPLIN
ncbi:hypothetical protein [Uliginosibacterium sediminicola]|uniref:Uncharacterized protein n=1 Tax=Uliginosibacterium sediminicola TaxID=2024550 RepID=A0ABU9Z2Y3_9RHOO